ncbi:RagB/SusD family nutrient uptake outer membrane protein [Mucilaginibacter sabulilitoris]|uniref:RagB/SusD family nutrient uptake outer membrane protein n=1 Tax=Mucilaginibacter sabulilitoris TaxID=1173583 RepID=A0ABZ0TIR4_9SPHI|nr:RagB/SusD family nutrient uptake outer membrane protein [Mucilaginibacter sabulilitoris]WPU92701.1 RagB/SusD family nutrient uptake outer membrane protein [Mucilaginibacter sabulilitoris]
MKTLKYLMFGLILISWGCKKTDDFLTKLPLDKLTDDTYWTSEGNVRTFAFSFYPTYFPGYASGFDLSWGGYFSGESLNDDFAPTTPTTFTKNVPATDNGASAWSFANIRRENLFLERIKQVPMPDEAIKHWTGVGRFFRALEYATKVKKYGDYPWYGKVLAETDTKELYRPRDPRVMVMDSVLADFNYAAANVRVTDAGTGPQGLVVNRNVVLAFMSRVFLFEGNWEKYQANNTAKANEYYTAAKWAANEVITKGGYAVAPDYRKIFNSLDLSTNPEIILYRKYQTGLLTHSLESYVNKEPQTGASKNAIESYLCKDGLPIGISPLYKGDKTITDVMADRDPRINATFVPAIRLNGVVSNYSSSGYAVLKFFNEDIKDLTNGNSSLNDTQAPVIRYGEVLINYADACAELGTLTQNDLDISINKLRRRNGIGIPDLQVMGGLPAVNGTVYDDPKRDPAVPSLLWEIRRERRTELMMEGFRNDDLRSWKKYAYVDTQGNPDINLGAWIKRSDYPNTLAVATQNNAPEGYVVPATKAETQRLFNDPKVYLSPLPLDQIKLYQDQGVDLKQNPGW